MANIKTASDAIVAGLVGVEVVGQSVPDLAAAIAIGLTEWASKIVVKTHDVGFLGRRENLRTELDVGASVLYDNLLAADTEAGLAGSGSAQITRGTANGLSKAFSKMKLRTDHPTVGSGKGRATFKAPPASPFMVRGLTEIGMQKKGKALGHALDKTFANLVVFVTIIGAAGPFPSVGSGSGRII